MVARSNVEAKYRAKASTSCDLSWLKHLLKELRIGEVTLMSLICDNQVSLHIVSFPVFHKRTKHIKMDCHFIWEKTLSGDITTQSVNCNDQAWCIWFVCSSLRGSARYILYVGLGPSLCNNLYAYMFFSCSNQETRGLYHLNVFCLQNDNKTQNGQLHSGSKQTLRLLHWIYQTMLW